MFGSFGVNFSASLKSEIASGNCCRVVYSMPRCCNADPRLGACLRSSWAALRKASTALSQSLFCVASNPSRENLAASLASLLPCAWTNCETLNPRAMIRVRAEYFFMISYWTLVFSGEFETQATNSWLQAELFTSVLEKAPARCRLVTQPPLHPLRAAQAHPTA